MIANPNDMIANLSISSEERSDTNIEKLTADFYRDLIKEGHLKAELAKVEVQKKVKGERTKGDPITIGLIIITALKSGAVVSLLNVLKSYLEKRPPITVKIKTRDGTEITIEKNDVRPENEEATIKRLNDMVGKYG